MCCASCPQLLAYISFLFLFELAFLLFLLLFYFFCSLFDSFRIVDCFTCICPPSSCRPTAFSFFSIFLFLVIFFFLFVVATFIEHTLDVHSNVCFFRTTTTNCGHFMRSRIRRQQQQALRTNFIHMSTVTHHLSNII